MPPGLDNLKHIVVLMMENRSFDHMLGSLTAVNPRIDGITDQPSNPDTTGASVKPQPLAEFQGQLDPDPDHHIPAVDLQIFGGDTSATRIANMQGFVKSYFNQQRDVAHSRKILYYFAQNQLPVLPVLTDNRFRRSKLLRERSRIEQPARIYPTGRRLSHKTRIQRLF